MAQTFYKNNLENKFIKNLLHRTPLPVIEPVHLGKYLIKGNLYLYKTYIIECTVNGILTDNPIERGEMITVGTSIRCSTILPVGYRCRRSDNDYICGSTLVGDVSYDPLVFIVRANYFDNDDIKINTHTFTSKTNYYDTETHEYLCKYLKYYYSLYNIDLFPFYNCFSNRSTTDFHFSSKIVPKLSNNGSIVNTVDLSLNKYQDKSKKVYLIPIDFNTDYTLALDSTSEVYIKPVIYSKLGLLDKYADIGSIKKYPSTSYKRPILINITIAEESIQNQEHNLYLAVQVSASNNSTITMLMGDYSTRAQLIFNAKAIDDIDIKEMNKILLSKLSLLSISDKQQYAYSDRLVEYLLNNPITSIDEYGEDFETIFNNINSDIEFKKAWTNSLRYKLYLHYMNSNRSKFDINGFIDKDVEDFVLKGGIK